jgi:hypothetical protein
VLHIALVNLALRIVVGKIYQLSRVVPIYYFMLYIGFMWLIVYCLPDCYNPRRALQHVQR